jgi:hypothetical protein
VTPEAEDSPEVLGYFSETYLNRVLPPIPDWMRKPPKPSQPGLFDND